MIFCKRSMGCDDLNSSRQDYLQTIYRLSVEKGYTTNKKIADFLSVSKPSVTEMIGKLQGEGQVAMDGAHIFLTEDGAEQANVFCQIIVFGNIFFAVCWACPRIRCMSRLIFWNM